MARDYQPHRRGQRTGAARRRRSAHGLYLHPAGRRHHAAHHLLAPDLPALDVLHELQQPQPAHRPTCFCRSWALSSATMAERTIRPPWWACDNYVSVVLATLGKVLSGFDFWRILLVQPGLDLRNLVFHVTIGVAVAVLLNQDGLWLQAASTGPCTSSPGRCPAWWRP